MLISRRMLIGLSGAATLLWASSSLGQIGGYPDPAGFVDFSLKTLSSFRASDRRGARALIAQQISILPADQQMLVTSNLLTRLQSPDINIKVDVANILALYPLSWTTNNTGADAKAVYDKFLNEKDETLKTALDSALANAKGLYRDGIRDFNKPVVLSLSNAEAKLRNMARNFPDSRYAENASFYLGLAIANQYILGEPHDPKLMHASNAAFEEYFKGVHDQKFGKKTDFLAAGYFFRGLNGWIQGDLKDARKWMEDGSKKFSDDDSIYIYQLILSPNLKSAVIDRFLPARSTFTTASKFFSTDPVPSYPNSDALTKALVAL